MRGQSVFCAAAAIAVLLLANAGQADPVATTANDFVLPGTQPVTVTDTLSNPSDCVSCHAGYGQPDVEPYRNWQGSMMAQAGRDPLWWAAVAIANQDAPESGELCMRCHMPKGWLDGRSSTADGSAMTADDREGVQCSACHRMVDPVADPANPAEDAAILSALTGPIPAIGDAMIVFDPQERRRGPFDVVTDLGYEPHPKSTLVSPYHSNSEICGTCHNVRNPVFTKNGLTGEWDLNTLNSPSADPGNGFPEQSTYDEWAASEYAATGVDAPQFGGNKTTVSSCQDCHMPDVTGSATGFSPTRTDLPLHTFGGVNTFIPDVLPFHPTFGSEVDATVLQEGIAASTAMLRKAATVSATLAGGDLTARVTNETGHKLPTGYPEGRRMWLHVLATDDDGNEVFESGRYVTATATLNGHGAELGDPDYDPWLQVWEAEQGLSAAVASATNLPVGKSFHLTLNNVRLLDNRIPPRGFTNAAFEAIDAEPVGAAFADGEYWDDVVYTVGPDAVRAEVTLYYQTTTREYVEFLRDENATNTDGDVLYDLWDQHNQSVPDTMARVVVETDPKVLAKCRKNVGKLQAKYFKTYYKEWGKCFIGAASDKPCDATKRDAKIDAAAAKVRQKLGGAKDRSCAGPDLTPGSIGHGSVGAPSTCPAPCGGIVLFDLADLADCTMCMAETMADVGLEAAYDTLPTTLPPTIPSTSVACQKKLDKAAGKLAFLWAKERAKCEHANATGKNTPALDCATDPNGKIAAAKAKAAKKVQACDSFAGIPGCATTPGGAANVQACLEAAVESVIDAYTDVAW